MKRIHFNPSHGPGLVPRMALVVVLLWLGGVGWARASDSPEYLEIGSEPGRPGGRLVVGMRTEPTTFNPVKAEIDVPSRTVMHRLMAVLVHINRETRKPESALARDWAVSVDGTRFTLELRRGLRFSDGQPFDADDVLFTFQVYLDEKIASGYRSLLAPDEQPMTIRKLGSHRVEFQLAKPFALGIKLFDSIGILPEHRLGKAYDEGRFRDMWGLDTPARDIVGLGPYRLRRFVPGERIELERNPHYWKVDREGRRLPYLDEIILPFVSTEEALVTRFQKGEIDVVDRIGAVNFNRLENAGNSEMTLHDLGPGFIFNFLFFNLNDIDAKALPKLIEKQAWFRDPAFRHAISRAIDRYSIIRLPYGRRAMSLASPVTPGNKLWLNSTLELPRRSLAKARKLLEEAKYTWDTENRLLDKTGKRVAFSIMTNPSSKQRVDMAAIIQEDLRQLGIDVKVVSLDFTALVDRLSKTFDYEAVILGLTQGTDPIEATSIWPSDGINRLWRLHRSTPEPAWQIEIDQLMREQVTVIDYAARKKLYDRVQEIIAEQEPCVLLVSPNILVGAKSRLGHFRPTILEHVTLWNIDELHWLQESSADRR